ncbi:MAG: T9SS type A sorting domain-containing protein [Winogradskyella sp.]|uniref:M4 family metallopeptidase n=1 Tax=Winogradskyella sp. TaxID=1883156 RepID=UPI0017A41D3E|nr:T9SS type A sorting domain-containing protein [Winogradskyella sp.]
MRKSLLSFIMASMSVFLLAQVKESGFDFEKLQKNPAVKTFSTNSDRETPSLILLNENADITKNTVADFLMDVLSLENQNYSLFEDKKANIKGANEVVVFRAEYNGVKLEHGVYKALIKNNKVFAISLEHYNLALSTGSTAGLTKDQARQYALNHVGADIYVWDEIAEKLAMTVNIAEVQKLQEGYDALFPQGELVYIDNYNTKEGDLTLAYKYNVYASKPLYRADVYVDANTGEILLADAIIKHADEINKKMEEAEAKRNMAYRVTASGDTRYAGTRTFETTLQTFDGDDNPLTPDDTAWSLDGTIDLSAFISDPALQIVLNETRSYDGVGGAPISVGSIPSYSIYDGYARSEEGQTVIEVLDNVWSSDEHWRNRFTELNYPVDNETNNDDVALDAHWGAEIVIRYWADVHGRSSYDNLATKVFNYVHYGDAYDNAFWNGTAMTYGDGSYQGGTNANGSFAPLTSMDVCGHEIGHGVCSATSDLVYARESGAMNEGFSDIWAAAVENYVLTDIDGSLPYDPWGIGEQIDERDGGLAPGSAGSRALRWMDDPKASGDPDTYGGENWIEPECGEPTLANDQCGVHTNSGVLNKWFYLMVEGSGQNFSLGSGKASADDEINDISNAYTVLPIGYDKAEQIAFQGEIMLTPNAKFKEMRDASITVTKALYGDFSNEEIQVTNAWYAVGVGEQYLSPGNNIIFFDADNTNSVSEATIIKGCDESNTFDIEVTAVNVDSPQTITLDFTDSTASAEDYSVSTNSLTFNASGTQSITVSVFNDALVEGSETIVMKFSNDSEVRTHTVVIKDDDYTPSIGNATIELVNESFDTTSMPAGWSTQSPIGLDPNVWKFNGIGVNSAGRAYIENRQTPDAGPNYNQTQFANLLLVTDVIDARGMSNVNISFDWTAGGETDAANEDVLFDYGEFLYSFDGVNFVSLETFVAVTGLESIATGTYDQMLAVLDDTQFQVAWRWYNDSLVGTEYSMTIDNVVVTGLPALVETELASTDSETVKAGNEIYFISDQDAGVMVKIENATADLGCVSVEVTAAGDGGNFTNLPGSYAGKVIAINADGVDAPTASYDVTLYYTYGETAEFADPSALQIIKVEGSTIDEATDSPNNYTIGGAMLLDNSDQQYRSYKGTFTGNSVFGLISLEVLSVEQASNNTFNVYPTIVDNGTVINIVDTKASVETVDIYSVTGRLVQSIEVSSQSNIAIPINQYASGMYFLTINKNKANTYKFIVK